MKLLSHIILGGLCFGGRMIALSQAQCFEAEDSDNRWSGLQGESAPWPPQCTGCQTAGEDKCNDYPCWCIPEGGTTGCCPDPGERPLQYEWQVAEAFKRNVETSDPIVLSPRGCNPWPENQELFPNLPICVDFDLSANSDAVCAFMYEENDEDCGGLDARNYKLQSFASQAAAEAAGGVVTHDGACGVCSNAHDLGVMMDPRTLFEKNSGLCASENAEDDVNRGRPIKLGGTYKCYKDLGLSDECAYVYAGADIAGRQCTLTCRTAFADPNLPGTLPDTCEWSSCALCQQGFREPAGSDSNRLRKWTGRDLWSSGLIAYTPSYHLKYPCADWANNMVMSQDPYAKGNKAGPSSTATLSSSTAENFSPSYSIRLNNANCFYDFKFSMKHDNSLPLAGGWNPVYPNGEDRIEFERLCNRDSKEIAEDGRPYHESRSFNFQFGKDVKDITGIFDHLSIVFNPCGQRDSSPFGRPHYDMRMFTVSDKWKSIMECDATSCDPNTCVFDASFQTSDSGRAFFDTDTCYEQFPSSVSNLGIQPGSFEKNMPFGFFSLADTATPNSGTASRNILNALTGNEMLVENWTYPVLSMRTFDTVITSFEPKVPAEYFQGAGGKNFSSAEEPVACRSLIGLPQTYSVDYDAETGFTTFQFVGLSPTCACDTETVAAPGQCEANEAALSKYDSVYEAFTGEQVPVVEDNYGPLGNFSVAEVEAAFDLEEGSLILPGTEHFECLAKSNFWTDYIGTPLTQARLDVEEATPRTDFFTEIKSVSAPLFSYKESGYDEHFVLGCFYSPKTPEINQKLKSADAAQCSDDPLALTGMYASYHVVAYVDEYTRLMFFGHDGSHVSAAQYLTQFVMVTVDTDFDTDTDELFAVEMKGPSAGDFSGFADPPEITDTDFLGNQGQYVLTFSSQDLTQPCPKALCGDIIPGGFQPNPAADPLAPWPKRILDNQCEWFSCADLPECQGATCARFDPEACASFRPIEPTQSPVFMPGTQDEQPTEPSSADLAAGYGIVSLLLGLSVVFHAL